MFKLRDIFSLRERRYGEKDWVFIKGGWWWRIKVREFKCKHCFGPVIKGFCYILRSEVKWTKRCSKCGKRKNVTPYVLEGGIFDKVFSYILSNGE